MELPTIVKNSRSYRRFDQSYRIPGETLRDLIVLAQYSPSGMNAQPLKFWLSNTEEINRLIFAQLGWAGGLKDWKGPADGERPSAYVIILGDTDIRDSFGVDHGIAAQSILLGAAERELGGCILASIKRDALRTALGIPERFEILLVIALGKPAEKIVTEIVGVGGDVSYYRDEHDVHHVPKRGLDELILHDV